MSVYPSVWNDCSTFAFLGCVLIVSAPKRKQNKVKVLGAWAWEGWTVTHNAGSDPKGNLIQTLRLTNKKPEAQRMKWLPKFLVQQDPNRDQRPLTVSSHCGLSGVTGMNLGPSACNSISLTLFLEWTRLVRDCKRGCMEAGGQRALPHCHGKCL